MTVDADGDPRDSLFTTLAAVSSFAASLFASSLTEGCWTRKGLKIPPQKCVWSTRSKVHIAVDINVSYLWTLSGSLCVLKMTLPNEKKSAFFWHRACTRESSMPKANLPGLVPAGERQQAAIATLSGIAERRERIHAGPCHTSSRGEPRLHHDYRPRTYTSDIIGSCTRQSTGAAPPGYASSQWNRAALITDRSVAPLPTRTRPGMAFDEDVQRRHALTLWGRHPWGAAAQQRHAANDQSTARQFPLPRSTSQDDMRAPSMQFGPAYDRRAVASSRLMPDKRDKIERVMPSREGASGRAVAGYSGHVPYAKEVLLGASIWRNSGARRTDGTMNIHSNVACAPRGSSPLLSQQGATPDRSSTGGSVDAQLQTTRSIDWCTGPPRPAQYSIDVHANLSA